MKRRMRRFIEGFGLAVAVWWLGWCLAAVFVWLHGLTGVMACTVLAVIFGVAYAVVFGKRGGQ